MKQAIDPLNFSQLKEGETYSIFNSQFNCTNRAKLVSFDTMGLNRPIAYFHLCDRPGTMTKERLASMFKNDQYPHNVFALWDHDLSTHIITPIN